MSNKQLVLSGKELIKFLESLGFEVVRVNDDLPKGLMRKIIREDISLELDEFEKLYKEWK
jgi:predicted RNA binding protein YcfA (HicA-like mRNA interferase family)